MNSPKDLLLPYQRAWVEDKSRFKAGVQARQTGKDFQEACEIAEECYTTPKTEWMIAAPSERQSLETLDKVKEWVEAFDLAVHNFTVERENSNHPQALLKAATIEFANGSKVSAVPGKPDTVRGKSANVALTEFAFFENPDATWRAIYPSITNPLRGGLKKIRVYSTPNGKGDRFHKIVKENYRGPGAELDTPLDPFRKMAWSVHRVTIEDAVRMGLPLDLEELKAGLDDPLGWLQEYLCEFLDGSNVLLPYELIALAESASATISCDPALFLARPNPLFVGIDFGRTTDPTVCVVLERVGGILWTREVLIIEDTPTDVQEKILGLRVAASTRTAEDYTGPGIGLGDYLAAKHGRWLPEKHQYGKVELHTFTTASKRMMFPRLRRMFEPPTTLRVPIDTRVREDLHGYRQIVKGGEFSYSAERTAKGHSDIATAYALAVHAAEAPAEFAYQSVMRARGRATTYRRRGGVVL